MKNKFVMVSTPSKKQSFLQERFMERRYKAVWAISDGTDNLSAAETEDLPMYKFRRCQQQKAIYNVEYLRDRKNKALENSLFGYQRNPWLSEKTAADMEKHIKAASERLRRLGKNAGYSAEIFRKACAAMNKLKNNDN